MDNLEELERLLAKATPGEWHAFHKPHSVTICFDPKGGYSNRVAECTYWSLPTRGQPDRVIALSNAALIVALRNAAPSLIVTAREVEGLRAEVARLREALQFYANTPCNMEFGVVNVCPYDDGDIARAASRQGRLGMTDQNTRPQPSAEPGGDLIERAKTRAMTLRWHEPIPVRVFVRDGCVIWSKVDDNNCNLTVESGEGMLYHAHSLFVPHGTENPLVTARPQPSAEPVAIFQAARRAWLAGPTIVRDPETHSVRIGDKEAAAAVIASALEAARLEALEQAAKAFEAEADTWKVWPEAGAAKRQGAKVIRALKENPNAG